MEDYFPPHEGIGPSPKQLNFAPVRCDPFPTIIDVLILKVVSISLIKVNIS